MLTTGINNILGCAISFRFKNTNYVIQFFGERTEAMSFYNADTWEKIWSVAKI